MTVNYQHHIGHCPSADDPRTAQIETDCQDVTAQDSIYKGQAGNLCQVDCANRYSHYFNINVINIINV
jgi:hypothetical protein